MEPIKIEVSVELNVSKDLKDFFSKLALVVSNNTCGCTSVPVEIPKASATGVRAPEISTPVVESVRAAEAPKVSSPEPVVTVETPKVVETPAVTISIEQVRNALVTKINGHREEIKEKLNSFGASSVTKLDPSKYSEMLTFLNSLS